MPLFVTLDRFNPLISFFFFIEGGRRVILGNNKENLSGNGQAKAPAAVVGFQFQHTALQALFQNITFNCDGLGNCHKHCGDDSWACYLIDNNAYIIAAENEADAGKFLGEVRGPIMNSLVKEGIFEKIRIFDYQAVCFKKIKTDNNAGDTLLTVRESSH